MDGGVSRIGAVVIASVLASCEADAPCPACEVTLEDPGTVVWHEAFNAEYDDVPNAIAVDAASGLVAVGGSVGEPHLVGTHDLWVGVLSHGGEPQWDARIHERFDETANAVAFDSSGTLWIAGRTAVGPYVGSDATGGWLGRFSSSGAEMWRARLEEMGDDDGIRLSFRSVAVGHEGRAFVGGTRYGISDNTAVAAAYDDDGRPAWTYVRDDVDGDSYVLSVFSRADDEAVFVGAALASGESQLGMLVLRMSAAGERLSERIVGDLSPHSVGLIRAGDSDALAMTTSDSLVVVSLEGERLREVAFEPDEDPAELAVAEDGGVFVVGNRTTGEGQIAPWAARYDAELTKVWDFVGEDGGELSGVAVGPNGDVFVTGRIVAPPFGGASDFTNYDIWMARIAG
jgi:hypothetical protein